jgi:hypothetical protein
VTRGSFGVVVVVKRTAGERPEERKRKGKRWFGWMEDGLEIVVTVGPVVQSVGRVAEIFPSLALRQGLF